LNELKRDLERKKDINETKEKQKPVAKRIGQLLFGTKKKHSVADEEEEMWKRKLEIRQDYLEKVQRIRMVEIKERLSFFHDKILQERVAEDYYRLFSKCFNTCLIMR
jgi:chaperonin cofactor prefoldin